MHNSSIIFRAKTAIGHTVLALLLTIIGHWILREWVDRLADWISERIDPLVARLVTLAMILLVSSALLALYKVWRRRARNAAAGGDRCRQASNLESVEYVGWALIGVLVAQAMSVGFLEHFASLFGPAVAARYPVIAGVGGISLVGATIAALFLQADWRRSAPADAGWHRDPMILRMNQL